MHQTCWFLFTPEPGADLLQEAEDHFTDYYALDLLDDNNWNSPYGVVTGDGRQVIVPGKEPVFSGLFGQTIPSPEELVRKARQEVAEDFGLVCPDGTDLLTFIRQEVPRRLAGLYTEAQGKTGSDYSRAILSEGTNFSATVSWSRSPATTARRIAIASTICEKTAGKKDAR